MRKKLLGLVVVIILILFLLYFIINPIPQPKNYEIKNKKFIEINKIDKEAIFYNESIEMTIGYWQVKLYQGDFEVNVTDIVNFKIEIISNEDINISCIGLDFNDTSNKFLESIYLDEILENNLYEINYTFMGDENSYRFGIWDTNNNPYYSKEFKVKIITPKTELNIKTTFDDSYTQEDRGLYFFHWTDKDNNNNFPSFLIVEDSYKNSHSDLSISIENNFNLYLFENKSCIIGFVEFLSRDDLPVKARSYTPKCFIESDFHLPPDKYEIQCYYREVGYGYENPWKIMILNFEIK